LESEFRDNITFDCTYIDEYGDVTSLSKTVSSDYLDLSELEILCELFKDFLVSAGFSYVKEINFVKE
jgi:hypothetical protein